MNVVPIGHPDAEPEDMGALDITAHGSVMAPMIDRFHWRGREPWCRCGWHEANHSGFTVEDHLRDMGVR